MGAASEGAARPRLNPTEADPFFKGLLVRHRLLKQRSRLSRGFTLCLTGISPSQGGLCVNNIIYIVGLVVVVIAVLSFFGLR
jgi:hypothetical protein